MKYMILHYFFMVHLCNIQNSAVSTRHKSTGKHYDIDGFITQLLASRKFDDLAEKLAEKAAYKIMLNAAPAPIERAADENEVDNSTDNTQEVNQSQYREYVKKYEVNQFNNVLLRKDFTGKINPQAVMNATISLSENLQLKYKYLKKNALEKKAKSNRDMVPLPKNDTKEDPPKHNKTTGPTDYKDHNNKTEERTYNQNATEKTHNDTKKESINEYKRSRDDTKDDDRTQDPNKNSKLNESFHSGMDGETNDSAKKQDHSSEEQSPVHELTISREAHNSRPEDKDIVEQEVSHVDLKEERASGFDEENQKHLSRSEEKIIEKVKKREKEPVKRGTGEINEDEIVIAQLRAREDSIEDNKLSSDYNAHVGVYRTRVSDDSGDGRSKEQSSEDQRSKEQSPEDQSSKEKSPEDTRYKEQSPENQSLKDHSAEDPNSSKLKPVIRKEGDKLYTYVRAPEYEDYHEKLAKWRKRHPVNPADFMK